MKISELRKAQKYLTSSATDKVKPKSNAKLVNTSKVQDSKPARARFIVNPATGQYENTAYVPTVKAPTVKAKPMNILTYIDKFNKENSYQPVVKEKPLRDIEQPFGSIINNLKNRNKPKPFPKEASLQQMAGAKERIDYYRATNGYADHQKNKKKIIAKELIKNFKPIEPIDIGKELQDVRDRSQRSAELDLQYQQLMKPRIDPDTNKGIASILKPKRSK